jgi:hypothetical protein
MKTGAEGARFLFNYKKDLTSLFCGMTLARYRPKAATHIT